MSPSRSFLAIALASLTIAGRAAGAPIADLTASEGDYPGEVKLAWTAPAAQPGAVYVVKYARVPVGPDSAAWWTAADAYNQSWAVSAETAPEARTLGGLDPGAIYYFAARVSENGVLSALDARAASAASQARAPAGVAKSPTLYITSTLLPSLSLNGRALRSAGGGVANLSSVINPGAAVTGGVFRFVPNAVNAAKLAALPGDASAASWIADQDVAGRALAGGTWHLSVGYRSGRNISGRLYVRLSKVAFSGQAMAVKSTLLAWTPGPSLAAGQAATALASSNIRVPAVSFGPNEYLLAEFAAVVNAAAGGDAASRDLVFEANTSNNFIRVNDAGALSFDGARSDAGPAPQAISGVSSVRIYPNPLRPSQGHSAVTFDTLPAGARLRIYTFQGELLEDTTADASGRASWSGRNRSGAAVASGVYLALIEGSGEKRTFTVAVQR